MRCPCIIGERRIKLAITNPYQTSIQQPYQGYQMPQQQSNVPAMPTQTGAMIIDWVKGRAGADAYWVRPNVTAWLFDTESQVFYVKSADPSGFSRIVSACTYEDTMNNVEYATKADVEELKKLIEELTK